MVDRRRWPTAAALRNLSSRFWGTHTLSFNRDDLPEATQEIAYEQDGSRNPNQLLTVGDRVRELYWSALQFESNEEHLWHFDRLLGFGSFGLVASYEKRDPDGQVLDIIATKSELARDDIAVNNLRVDLSREAYHLAELNERNSGRILGLRGYKYLTSDASVMTGQRFEPPEGEYYPTPLYREWRSFLELCDLGNLYGFILKYKAWGYHLPEAFIWWTFLQLMEACKSMGVDSNNPFTYEGPEKLNFPWPKSYMLHNDMKEENIFVKPQPENTAWQSPYNTYPFIHLADFGLSEVTAIDAPTNKASKINTGTLPFLSPEKRKLEMESSFYPFTQYLRRSPMRSQSGLPLNKRSHPVSAESNVWGVGAIIYLLMTLRDGEELSRIVDRKLDYRAPSKPNPPPSWDVLDLNDFGPGPGTNESEDYSPQLKQAVMMCTRIVPSQRPDPGATIERLKFYMDLEVQRLNHEFNGNQQEIYEQTKLNMTHDDWNQTPRGPFWQDIGVSLTPPLVRPAGADWLNYFWIEFWNHCDKFVYADEARLIPPTACQAVNMGQDYLCKDFIGQPNTPGQVADVVYYPYQYNQVHSYHSRTFFPPGGRAIGPRTQLEQLAQQGAPGAAPQRQQTAPPPTAEQIAAYQADVDEITRQEEARQVASVQQERQQMLQQATQRMIALRQRLQQRQQFAPARPPPVPPTQQGAQGQFQAPPQQQGWTPEMIQQRQQLLAVMQQQQQQQQYQPGQQPQAPQGQNYTDDTANRFDYTFFDSDMEGM